MLQGKNLDIKKKHLFSILFDVNFDMENDLF